MKQRRVIKANPLVWLAANISSAIAIFAANPKLTDVEQLVCLVIFALSYWMLMTEKR